MPHENALFRIMFHIGRGHNTEMPEALLGAYVYALVAAEDHNAALMLAGKDLVSKGFEIRDVVEGKIYQQAPDKWDSFIAHAWADYADYFPRQARSYQCIEGHFCLLQPFCWL